MTFFVFFGGIKKHKKIITPKLGKITIDLKCSESLISNTMFWDMKALSACKKSYCT